MGPGPSGTRLVGDGLVAVRDFDTPELHLTDALPEGAKVQDVERYDVVSGPTSLLATVVVPDEAGGTEAVEVSFVAVKVSFVAIESASGRSPRRRGRE